MANNSGTFKARGLEALFCAIATVIIVFWGFSYILQIVFGYANTQIFKYSNSINA